MVRVGVGKEVTKGILTFAIRLFFEELLDQLDFTFYHGRVFCCRNKTRKSVPNTSSHLPIINQNQHLL